MSTVLHLLSHTADEQTRQIHRMLIAGLGPPFTSDTWQMGSKGSLRNLPGALLELRRQKPDIVCAWGSAALTAAVIGNHRRIFFSPDRFAGPRALRWIRSLMSRANVIFIAPTFTQQRLAAQYGIDPDRVPVIPPGVDFGRIRRRNPELRAAFNLTPDDYVILTPGETTLSSGHDHALWTCGILNVLDRRHKLLLWGRGSRVDDTADLARRLNQSEMVRKAEQVLKRPVEFEELLSIADVCLATPAGPAPTLPIATAMSAGVPIVSTVTYVLAELLEDRHTALMVPTRSPRALVQRLLDLREDTSLLAKLTDTARAEAYEHFSMTKMLDKYREIFDGRVNEQIPSSQIPIKSQAPVPN